MWSVVGPRVLFRQYTTQNRELRVGSVHSGGVCEATTGQISNRHNLGSELRRRGRVE